MFNAIFSFVVLTILFAVTGAIWNDFTKDERIRMGKFILKCMGLAALSLVVLFVIVSIF